MNPIACYTETWLFNRQHVELYPDRLQTQYERRWGARAERVFPIGDLQDEPDRYWAKDYGRAKVFTVVGLALFIACILGLSAWNGFTPVPEWDGASHVLTGVLTALAVAGILAAFVCSPRIEYRYFTRRAGGDGFWIGKRGPQRAAYEAFVATVRDHIRKAAKAA